MAKIRALSAVVALGLALALLTARPAAAAGEAEKIEILKAVSAQPSLDRR